MRRFLPIAFVLLIAVALLLARIGQPLPLPKPPSAADRFSSLSVLKEPYERALRDALLSPHEYPKCQLVAVPSFEAEWAVYLTRENRSAPQLVSRRIRKHLWAEMIRALSDNGAKDSFSLGQSDQIAALKGLNIEVETSERIITVATADILDTVWSRMLERGLIAWAGVDGIRYYLFHWSQDGGFRSGQTWSPPDGSRPHALVKLAEQMRGLTLKPSPEAEVKLRADASTLLSTLKSVVPSRSEALRSHGRIAAQ